ncbi:ABC transporter substrate-binding protein [Nostocoides sp. F2B08]|uniref:ABC transporter substrate-binding protein n=1 Tax=Nostocoides sp. F2B08 TaxID=2653936 RepID=UPI001263C544|nr:ABC transporter substrate-binding protein [Tetrasphaera sp. F2B08]KAB7746273.1 ABC transporter substrate-binding protein [Tetrasphaera sp. F2B08]
MTFKRKAGPLVGLTAAALVLTACATSERDSGTSTDTGTAGTDGETTSAVFTFGGAGAPATFDPYYASDGETFRVSRQIFENLIGITPGTADLEPELAESWEPDDSGLNWTFTLRDDVTFHDGTPFDAEAACANFERMFDQNEVGRSVAYYWGATFGAFADDADNSLYQGCEVTGEHELVMTISRVTSKFPAILSLTSFGMQSPTALEEGDANGISQSGEAFVYPENANNPVGTGPYTFSGYDEATRTVTLERYDEYWGEPAKTEQIVIRAIPDESTRRQELQAGGIDGYDLPNPVDWQGLEDEGNQVEVRPAFNVFYLGLNPTNNEALKDLRVRQAIYHALNREQLVQTQLPEGAAVATQFMPDTVAGYNSELEPYPYDPERAQQLLAEAGAEDLTLVFAYPTEVTRPYMPDPVKLYDAMKADLEAVGITVETVTDPWAGGYLDKAYTDYDAHFLGWTGDINSADNFLASFFGNVERNRFATNLQDFGTELGEAIVAADGILDEAERTAAYEELNQRIMEEWLPGLPISHSSPAIVVSGDVTGLVASPLTAERFDTIEVSGGN